MDLREVLSERRCATQVNVSSKKRLLERVAALLLEDNPGIDRNTVFQILIERERLGSTGIGNGVALPHGRVSGLDRPIGAVLTLDRPLDFDAIDQQPIRLAFGLLVPAQANEEHLQLLAFIARMLSETPLRSGLFAATRASDLYALVTDWKPPAPQPS